MEKWYDTPTQIRFMEVHDDRWIGGIAYRDEIICGCCGTVISLNEFKGQIMPFEYWLDISHKIMGD